MQLNKAELQKTADQFDIGKSTVADIYKSYKERDNNRISLKSGRPRITSERQDKILIRAAKNDPRKNTFLLNAEIKEFYNVKCSADTTMRRLRSPNLFGRRPAKKPFISIKNRKARLRFANEHLNWSREQWSKILFSDEPKFMLFGSDGIRYVRRPKGHRNDLKYQDEYFSRTMTQKHTSTLVKDFFKTKKIRLMEWSSQSPDLNPI